MIEQPRSAEQTLDEGELASVLGYRLAQASLATREVFEREVGKVHALRPIEFSLLALVVANQRPKPAALARTLCISRPLATQAMDRLEARGLLRREPNALDGRAMDVVPSAAGLRLVVEALRRLREGEQRRLSALSPAEQAMLAELLAKAGRRP
jgi:DNA-binding MarR family transcriptional regulator